MNIKNTLKPLLALMIMHAICTGTHAQSFKTNESISSQLKKGSVPGLQYASTVATNHKPAEDNTGAGKESLIDQVRKGTAANLKFKTSQAGGPAPANAVVATKPKYVSDLPFKRAPETKSVVVPVPSQESAGTKNN